MNQIELFYKIYNNEISEDDVIVIHTKFGHEEDQYILNDGFDYWNENGIKTLSFFDKTNDEIYFYDIISKEKYQEIVEKKEKEEEIFRLEQKLLKLKGEN